MVESFKDNITLLNVEGYIPNELMELYSPKGDGDSVDDIIKDEKNVRNLADKIKLNLHFRELMKIQNSIELKTTKEVFDDFLNLV